MGDQINVFLDDLSALFWRISQFPIAFQLLIWIVASGLIWVGFLFFFKKVFFRNSTERTMTLWWISFVLTGIPVVFAVIIDARSELQKEESQLLSTNIVPVVEVAKDSLYSSAVSLENLQIGELGTPVVKTIWAKKGIEVFNLTFQDPNAFVVMAIADLNAFTVELDTAILKKELTSEFAKRFNCEVAVNGEAGSTPGLEAPLGHWTGNYVVKGQALKMEDSDKRPFLYFSEEGKGFYSKDLDVVKELTADMYNVIWGRFDIILNGIESIDERDHTKEKPYPRTVMGIDESGTKIFLLVADGRKPQHSRGLTLKECAAILMPYGCYNAMACDQGGSSCMYVEKFGIVNRPADGGERKVYTHFGLRRN